MRGGDTSRAHQDVLLARLYQQIIGTQEPRFGAEHDLTAGPDRYRIWPGKPSEDAARHSTTGAGSLVTLPTGPDGVGTDQGPGDRGARPASVTEDLVTASGAFQVPLAGGTERSADLAVIELYSMHYRSLVRLATMLVRDVPTAEEVVQDGL
jgi:hypothetical protein